MSQRRLLQITAATAKVVTAASTSIAYDVAVCQTLSLQYNITAVSTPVGTAITLQRSNDGVNWTTYQTVAVSAIATGVLDVTINAAAFVRIAEGWTSGSFTYSATLVGLGL